MLKLIEFVEDYLGDHKIGYADTMISEYIRTQKEEYSNYEIIKLKIEEILSQKPNVIFSKVSGKFVIKDTEFKNPVISRIYDFGSVISGRIINNNIDNKLADISENDIQFFFKDFKILNLRIYESFIDINCVLEEVSVSIHISPRDFQIRTNFSSNLENTYPFLDFLEGKNEYILNKKGYLPLDSISYLSFIKIQKLLFSKFDDISLKIDIYEHIQ
ncbi:MAG: hypothetical protein JXA99_09825 [Candidatus Lokiarchaeota archaeon]|nr:hypothetical protein [Candidatus Lokiarchaeota archaeon]